MADDFEIGYGKPPKHSRFRKGQSGNLLGRPKGSTNVQAEMKRLLAAKTKIKVNGAVMTVPRSRALCLAILKPSGRGVTVVGDDAQSIYSFRAATVRNILDFPAAFSPPAEIVTLDRNYRSTQAILSAANGVIDLAAKRFTKNLWTDRNSGPPPQLITVRDEAEQARYIVERVLEYRESGSTLKQQAVLFRTSHHSGPLEIELTRRNIPFVKFGGLKFLDAAHIKDLLALLRFVDRATASRGSACSN